MLLFLLLILFCCSNVVGLEFFVGRFGNGLLLNFLILSFGLGSGFCCSLLGCLFVVRVVVVVGCGGLVGCGAGWFLFSNSTRNFSRLAHVTCHISHVKVTCQY